MQYTKQDIFNIVKSIIMEKYDGIDPKEINTGVSLKHDFKFDSLDLLELVIAFEEKCNISIKDTSRLLKAYSLGEFCYLLHKQTNQESPMITETKEDVFKYVNEYLLDKYNIMNARPSDNLFIDLHFTDFDRSELIAWAETKFDIRLIHTYFINLDDFCEKVLSMIRSKKIKEIQKTNFLQRIKQRFVKQK